MNFLSFDIFFYLGHILNFHGIILAYLVIFIGLKYFLGFHKNSFKKNLEIFIFLIFEKRKIKNKGPQGMGQRSNMCTMLM